MSLNVLFLASDMSCHLRGYYVHLRSGMPGYLLFLELAKSDLELGFFVFECIFLSKYH